MPKNNNRKHRRQVYEKCNFKCMHCGKKFIPPEDWNGLDCIGSGYLNVLEIDHIIPVSKGGSDRIENKQSLCWKCNNTKSNKLDGKRTTIL